MNIENYFGAKFVVGVEKCPDVIIIILRSYKELGIFQFIILLKWSFTRNHTFLFFLKELILEKN